MLVVKHEVRTHPWPACGSAKADHLHGYGFLSTQHDGKYLLVEQLATALVFQSEHLLMRFSSSSV